ncbi:MAG: SusC/RagA family TonB-linked outer membrane protein [Balneolaceae bacterium]
MNKKLLILTLVILSIPVFAVAQGSITGVVTDNATGEVLPGANVIINELSMGVATNINGEYTLNNVPSGTYKLTVSFVSFKTHEVSVTVGSSQLVLNVALMPDYFGLDELVVTGVSDATSQRKLPFTVSKVSSEQLQAVPPSSVGSAIQGKVAGAKVTSASGMPGVAPTIRLRGSTALIGSQQPLFIVDGVILDASLQDINMDDVESIEVIKGASAASLYGSRAANGVVQIITKRGKYLKEGQTQIVFRNEFGFSTISRKLDLAEHHQYEVTSDGKYADAGGNALPFGGTRVPKANDYADNPYYGAMDMQDEFFESGAFLSNYISLQRNTGNGNYGISVTNFQSDGIVFGTKGYGRQNVRANIDQEVFKGLTFSMSTSYGQSDQDLANANQGSGTPFWDVLFMQPDADVYGANPDGSKYRLRADPYIQEPNPLYELNNVERDYRRIRLIGDFRLNYRPTDWVTLETSYGLDRSDNKGSVYTPLGYLSLSAQTPANPEGVTAGGGSLSKSYSVNTSEIIVGTATFRRDLLPNLNTRLRVSYQYENRAYESFNVAGNNFSVSGVPHLGITEVSDGAADSYNSVIKSENIFGLLDVDYKDRYIASFLVRQDGSSEFGADSRYATYYRVSGAYRLTEDFNIPHVDEIKLRASYGTAGLRPGFSAQYETYSVSSGSPTPVTLGNKDLKPAFSEEIEIGADIEFLGRFSLQMNYSTKTTSDQIIQVPLPSPAGFSSQWRNAGTLESESLDASLSAAIINKKDMSWTATLLWDRTRQRVTEINFPSRLVGPTQQSNAIFFLTEGEDFGIMYGKKWVKSFKELQDNPIYATASAGDYTVNSDGYLIATGTEGTSLEKPIRYVSINEKGQTVEDYKIGNTNPDFNISLSNTFSWKNLSVYALLDAQIGGEVYNLTRQWLIRENRHGDVDQSGKPDSKKKTTAYYQGLYAAATINEHFVEDASYLKLREVAINYTIDQKQLGSLGNSLQRIKVGVIGRNLLTFTNYTGYDPEVAGRTGDASNYRIDAYMYPSFRTITGVIEIAF